MNLIDKFEAAFAQDPAAPCCIVDNKVMRRIDFYRSVCKLAKALHAQGIQPGDVVGLTLPQAPVHLAMIVAIARLGAISLPVFPKSPGGVKRALLAKYGAKYLILPKAPEKLPEDLEFKLITMDQLVDPAVETPKNLRFMDYWPAPEDLGRLSLTSGTTGTPCAIAYTHAHWLTRIENTSMGYDDQTRLIPGDLHLTMGNISSLAAMFKGGVVVFQLDQDLANMAKLIALHGVTHAMLTPASLPKLASFMPGDGNAFPSLKQLRAVGGSLADPVFKLTRQKITPHLYLPYGSSEVGLITMATPEMQMSHPNHTGKPRKGVTMEVVDENDQVLPAGQSGELRVKIAGMPTSYYKDEERTREKFKHGWYYTSDIGTITPDGFVKVEGRLDDRINLGGIKFFPEELENVFNTHPLIAESAVVSKTDANGVKRLFALLVPKPSEGPLDLKLGEFCKEKKFGGKTPGTFIVIQSLPRNPAGKILRKDLPGLIDKMAKQQAKAKELH